MGRLFAAAVLAVVMAGCATLGTQSISKFETRHLPREVVTARVVAQIAELVGRQTDPTKRDRLRRELLDIPAFAADGPDDARFERLTAALVLDPDLNVSPHPLFPLRHLNFLLKPYAASLPDMCISKSMSVEFEPVPHTWTDARAHVRVASFRVSNPGYLFLAPPAAPEPKLLSQEDKRVQEQACALLDPVEGSFVSAPSEGQAVFGTWLAQRLPLKTADAAFAVGCPPDLCTHLREEVRDEKIGSIVIESCKLPDMPQAMCEFTIHYGTVKVKATYTKAGDAVNILRADLDYEIILWSQGVD